MSASISRVQHILRWFESQRQLVFYASSLLFVYEGLPSAFSSSTLSSLLSTPTISPTAGDSGWGGEEKARQEGVGQKEDVAENNNNNIQAAVPWDYSLATIYANHRKGGLHHCTKSHLHGNSGDGGALGTTVSPVSAENMLALCEEDNSAWTRSGESQLPPNGNKSQLEGKDEGGAREVSSNRSRREEEMMKGRADDATEWSGGDAEVRMIDFAHVFPNESHDHGYIYGLKHLLTVLEQILCDVA